MVFEIRNWLKDHGYCPKHIFVVDEVFVNVSPKLSDEDILKFNNEFNTELKLSSGSFSENGELNQVEYVCCHEKIEKFRKSIRIWLKDHDFPVMYFMVCGEISLHCSKRLSHVQITDFSDRFNVKCRRFNISCNSDDVTYVFS